MERILRGGDKSAPEHNKGLQYCDPFPTDVYYLGNLIKNEFIAVRFLSNYLFAYSLTCCFPQTKRGFDPMKSLIDDMTAEDPVARPTMDEVMTRFEAIRNSLSTWKLRSRVVARDEIPIVAPFRMVPHWLRRVYFILSGTPALPSPKK